ncbi:MAG: epoxyqueuosine reductase QueH [Ruminococcaceae bacterium]|nr:epoxyqueuosine reductase QueH [Oscillospiraceae bacterium]
MTEEIIEKIKDCNKKPSLLLHVCCAPCSSYVLEYLNEYFEITLYYYNPNISPESEYLFRLSELKRLTKEMPLSRAVKILYEPYGESEFLNISKGLENLPEGGARCKKCYRLRLEQTAKISKEKGFDFFTTTLSISPYKNANWLNEIGKELSEKYGIEYLFSDFKKKNGYKRSIELSAVYNLYRQDYCGCVYSKEQAQIRRLEKNDK